MCIFDTLYKFSKLLTRVVRNFVSKNAEKGYVKK